VRAGMILEEKEHFIEIDIKLSDGTLIGTAEIEPNEKMLERFAIFEPYQNKGYGQQVLSDLIDTYGIRKLWVRSDNKRAIHVYEKAGFSRTKETMFEMERGKE
jgi:ribosomal protein S18 acetylase RimI-like enzyme